MFHPPSGALTRLFAKEDPFPNLAESCVELLGHKASLCTAFTSQHHLFRFLHHLSPLHTLSSCDLEQCVKWLQCMEIYSHRFILLSSSWEKPGAKNDAEQLLKWLKHIVNHQQILVSSLKTESHDSHVTQLSLYIHWTAISVTYRLAQLTGWQPFLEQARITLSWLVSFEDFISSSFPDGTYYQELWILLRHAHDHSTFTFWSLVSSVISDMINQSHSHHSVAMESDHPITGIILGWRIVEYVARLYRWTEEGGEDGELLPHWDILHYLLPLTFHQDTSEEVLKTALTTCISLTKVWSSSSPSIHPCLAAWDYYQKHIEKVAADSEELSSIEKLSPRLWLSHLLTFFDRPHPPTSNNSYQLFLYLIYVTMEKKDDEGKIWRALKGRFYSKIHARWLSMRNTIGLHRTLSLLITLILGGAGGEVALWTVSLLSHCTLSVVSDTSHLLWKAVFAMMLLLLRKQERLDDVISKLQPALDAIVKPPPKISHDQWLHTLSVVMEGTVEVVEVGREYGATALISSHLSDLLSSVEESDMEKVVGMVESLSHVIPTSSIQLFWQHCGQPLLNMSLLPLPPTHLSTTLASITQLTSQSHTTHHLSQQLVQHLTKDCVSVILACDFFTQLIESDVIRCHILAITDVQCQILHAWFRCLAQEGHTSSVFYLHQLTSLLPKLPMVLRLLCNQTTPTDPMAMFPLLLKTMEACYMDCNELEWKEKLNIILGDISIYLEPSIAGQRGTPAIRHSYHVAGLIVSMAPRLTYSRTDSHCLLPRLLDWLILPLSSITSKPQPQGTGPALKSTLHLFLGGLFRLDPVRDNFVKRKVKQIFSRYFHEYCQPHPLLLSLSQNPFLLAMQPWFDDGGHGDTDILLLVMDVVISQTQPQVLSSTLLTTLLFIKKVVHRIQNQFLLVKITVILIGHMTSCLLSCEISSKDSSETKCCVLEILKLLLSACKHHQLPCSDLLPPLTTAINTYYPASIDHSHLTRTFSELTNLYPDLFQQLFKMTSFAHHHN